MATEIVTEIVTFSDVAKESLNNYCRYTTVLEWFLMACSSYIVLYAEYMDNIDYTAFKLGLVVGLFKSLKEDIVLWQTTNGNNIDMDTAYELFTIKNDSSITTHGNVHYEIMSANLNDHKLDVRYYLCDELRSPNTNLDLVRDLLETFPGYMNILDRGDGLSTPFQLACQYCSVDIVKYMVEFDNTLLEYRDGIGDTPLHWACRGIGFEVIYYRDFSLSFQGLDAVNYILEKRMSLVTVANEDGDLPIHVACDILDTFIGREEMLETVCTEIVWRLLLAYPDCLNCVGVGGSTVINSNETDLHSKKNN